MTSNAFRRRTWAGVLGYPLLIGGAIASFLLVRWLGSPLIAPSTQITVTAPAPHGPEVLLHVLLALLVVMGVARLCGALCQRIQQPPVVGEVMAGILLGPSLLGRISPDVMHYVLPAGVAPYLSVIAQLGVILFMFIVGLELDLSKLRQRTHATVAISHASIVVPFALGAVLALGLYPVLSTNDVPFTVFALFLGVSLSVTAFPVLARILADRGLQKTDLGVIALTCAAVDDVTAWCLLAFLVAVAKANVSGAMLTVGLAAAYLAFMALVARPLIGRALRRQELRKSVSRGAIAWALIALLLSTLATEAAGVHAIFGAFVLGAIIPHDSRLARELTHKLEDVVVVLFLPAFFAFTGMRTELGLVHGATEWMLCGVILTAACLGKFGGTFFAARATGLGRRTSASLGVLMNTRGLMELVVLNIGLDLGIISPTLFAMLVIMAVVTTFATSPVLQLITRSGAEPEPGALRL